MVSNGHSIVISVRLLRAPTKGRWLMQVGAFCIDLQDSMHGHTAVMGTIGIARGTTTPSQQYLFTVQKHWHALCHVAWNIIDSPNKYNNCIVYIILDWTRVRFEFRSMADIDLMYWSLSVPNTSGLRPEYKSVLYNLCPTFSSHASKDSHDSSSA